MILRLQDAEVGYENPAGQARNDEGPAAAFGSDHDAELSGTQVNPAEQETDGGIGNNPFIQNTIQDVDDACLVSRTA